MRKKDSKHPPHIPPQRPLSPTHHLSKGTKTVGIFLDHKDAVVPTHAYKDDVGYDLYAVEDVEIFSNTFSEVSTGVHLALPKGMFAQINTRSSYGKQGMYIHHGVIDPGYTGELTLWIMNISAKVLDNGMVKSESFVIKKGDKIAQLLFHKAETPKLKVITKLPTTERGEKGHGSSGK